MFEEYIITFCLLVLVFSRHTFKLALTRDFKEKKRTEISCSSLFPFQKKFVCPHHIFGHSSVS